MNLSTKDMTLVAIFTSLTAIGAFISLPLGALSISLQSLFVILSGIILGPKLGAFSQIVYVILGLIGIPIFSGFTGGIQSIMKPSFGFIIGFVFAAYLVGKVVHNKKIPFKKSIWLGSFIGILIIYAFGLPYMYYILNIFMENNFSFLEIIQMGLIIFIPGDFIKFIIASFLGIKLLPILYKLKLI